MISIIEFVKLVPTSELGFCLFSFNGPLIYRADDTSCSSVIRVPISCHYLPMSLALSVVHIVPYSTRKTHVAALP